MISSISIVSQSVLPILIFFLVIPVPVYIKISHSPSETIDTESNGSVTSRDHSVLVSGEKFTIALFPIYDCHSGIAILTVESRFALATLERAVITPESVLSSTITSTDCPIVRFDTRLGSISIIICGCFPVKSAICDPIFTDCHIFAITREMIPSTGAVTLSFA